jgi:hypothetical protein
LVADHVLDLLTGGSSIAGKPLMHQRQLIPAGLEWLSHASRMTNLNA